MKEIIQEIITIVAMVAAAGIVYVAVVNLGIFIVT